MAFLALTDNVEVQYKMSEYWAPSLERRHPLGRPGPRDRAGRSRAGRCCRSATAKAASFRQAEVFP